MKDCFSWVAGILIQELPFLPVFGKLKFYAFPCLLKQDWKFFSRSKTAIKAIRKLWSALRTAIAPLIRGQKSLWKTLWLERKNGDWNIVTSTSRLAYYILQPKFLYSVWWPKRRAPHYLSENSTPLIHHRDKVSNLLVAVCWYIVQEVARISTKIFVIIQTSTSFCI